MIGLSRAPKSDAPRGYGNIYTPHAGSMIIQVARESGLQGRTFVLTQRQVRLLRFFLRSNVGRVLLGIMVAIIAVIAAQAARVPTLTYRLARLEHDAARLDTLERSLAGLQKRYDQVQRMLGASATPTEAFPAAGDTLHRVVRAPRTPKAVDQSVEPVSAPVVSPASDSSAVTPPPKPADPMD